MKPTELRTVSVIIPAYTLARWELLSDAVARLQSQTRLPDEIILCIDHNPELYDLCLREPVFCHGPVPVRILHDESHRSESALDLHKRAHGTRRRFGAGSARNAAARTAAGDLLFFQDDDAAADPNWIATIVDIYDDPSIVAVGGAPLPRYETARPRWFPFEFDWVFGCAYRGLPTFTAPARHLIGANLTVRHSAFDAVGGFHSVDFDDLDLCLRLAAAYPGHYLMYEPRAVVYHHVPADRVSWQYFWRRPYYVNKAKVEAFTSMGGAANLAAELHFVTHAITRGTLLELKDVLRGDPYAFARMGAMLLGIGLAGVGHVAGRIEQYWRVAPSYN